MTIRASFEIDKTDVLNAFDIPWIDAYHLPKRIEKQIACTEPGSELNSLLDDLSYIIQKLTEG